MHNDTSSSIANAGESSITTQQVVDGNNQDNLPGTQAATELARTGGRWRAVKAGSIIGVMAQLEANQIWTAGSCVVEVFVASVNPVDGVRTETATGLTATLDSTNPSTKIVIQNSGLDTFDAGDEVFAKFTTSSWTPTTADLRVAILVEF
jgi:hypothetical protein